MVVVSEVVVVWYIAEVVLYNCYNNIIFANNL